MTLLHIFDASDWSIRLTASQREYKGTRVPCGVADEPTGLIGFLDAFIAVGQSFDSVLFETHGAPGRISLGPFEYDAKWLRAVSARSGYWRLTTPNARVYFNGCNVAADDVGWEFLEAAASLFIGKGGGQVFGQTSLGFANPFSGHVVHLWGDTRSVFVDFNGNTVRMTNATPGVAIPPPRPSDSASA
jgi:Domain of unknown function (DUF4347)